MSKKPKSHLKLESSSFLFPEIYISSSSNLFRLTNFKGNKGDIDLRDQNEKLMDLQEQLLSEDLTINDKFTILSQINSIMKVLHTEYSIQYLRSEAELGFFFNENLDIRSALRHLEKAHSLGKRIKMDQDELINIAAEIALAHLYLKREGVTHINQAQKALKPYYNTSISDSLIRFKRDLSKSRILSIQKKYDASIQSYQSAITSLQETNEHQSSEIEGQLFLEVANNIDEASKSLPRFKGMAKRCYMRAHEIFIKIGDKESADAINPNKLPASYRFELEHPGEHMKEEEDKNEKIIDDATLLATPLNPEKIEFVSKGAMSFEKAPKRIRKEIIKIQNQLQNFSDTKKIRIEYIPNSAGKTEDEEAHDSDGDKEDIPPPEPKSLPPPSKVVAKPISSSQSYILSHDQFEAPKETKVEDVKKFTESEEDAQSIAAINNLFLSLSSYKREMDAQPRNIDTDDQPKVDPLDRFRRRRRKKDES